MGYGETQEVVQDKNLPEISNGHGFVDLLQQENIHDLNDPRMETKVVNNIVIIIIDGRESFSVKGESNFDQFKHMFSETQSVTNATQEELDNVQQDIELNPIDFQDRIDTYKEFYKKQKRESGSKGFWLNTNSAGKEKTAYKITAKEADVQLKKLDAIEQRFHQLSNPNRYKNKELARIEREVSMKQLSKELDEIWSKLGQFTEYRNDIITGKMDTTPPFKMTINSINDARNISNILKNFNKQQRKSNEYAADAATQQQYAQVLKSLQVYFEQNLNNPDQFQPYQFSAEQLLAINYFPKLKEAMGNIMPKEEQTDNKNTKGSSTESQSQQNQDVKKSFDKQTQKEVVAYTDVKDAFSRGGINGMIDYGLSKTNMNDTQKETWKSIGNMGIMIGAGVVAWNFFKNAFKVFTGKGRKDLAENGGRAWIAGPAALMFGANAWKGESITGLLNGGPLSKGLADRTGDMAGKGKSVVDQAKTTVSDAAKTVTETEPVTNEGLEGTAELFNGLTCSQVADLLEKDSTGKMKIKPDQYKALLTTLKKEPNDTKKAAAAKYLEKIGEQDDNNMIDITLTSMGLTLEKLKEPANEKTTFNEQLDKVRGRIGALADLMITKYNHINPEQRHLIVEYVRNPNATQKDLTALEERGDVFEKAEEFPPDAKRIEFKTKIDKFNLKEGDKENLKNGLNSFWHLWNTDEATKNKMDIKEENGSIVLSTYGQKTKLNLQEKSMIGIENGKEKKISFGSTAELLKAANLINRIFDLVSAPGNKTNVTKDPFNISLLGRDVEYDNTKFWSSLTDTKYNHKDITVISGGIGGALKGVAPALEQDKQAFVGLLNKRFNEVNNLN